MKHIQPYKLFESNITEHPGFPKTEDEIHRLCEKYEIENYIINDDLSIDVKGNVFFFDNKFEYIPLNFNHVYGSFSCKNSGLISLKGSPCKVEQEFIVSHNKLTSLQYSPEYVGTKLYFIDNMISELKYFPEYIGSKIYSMRNPIDSVIYKFTDDNNVSELIKEFNEYSIIRKDEVVLSRLKAFINDFDLEMPDIELIKEDYKIV